MAPSSAACFSAPDDSDLGLGLFLGIGTFLSYVPSVAIPSLKTVHCKKSNSHDFLVRSSAEKEVAHWIKFQHVIVGQRWRIYQSSNMGFQAVGPFRMLHFSGILTVSPFTCPPPPLKPHFKSHRARGSAMRSC